MHPEGYRPSISEAQPRPEVTQTAEQAKSNLLARLSTGGYSDKTRTIAAEAKKFGMSFEELQREMRKRAKDRNPFPEKTHHFHRTGLENFESIAHLGRLLSRSKLQEADPDARVSGTSASDDVMMTMDRFDNDGRLWKPGLSEHGVGNKSGGVTIVLKPTIQNLEHYDAINEYPTVEEASLETYCSTVLVQNAQDIQRVEKILQDAGLPKIKVELYDNWVKEHYDEMTK